MSVTLCLNMIVKNESRIINRFMESIYPLIDSYCICDTGSTDNTVYLIETFFAKKGISGCVIYCPFVDFGFNRTHALIECNARSDSDYIIFLDADMMVVIPQLSPTEIKALLVDDYHFIFQGTNTFLYKNCRIVRNVSGYSYWGVTHEYIKCPEDAKSSTLPRDIIFINDIGDGGSKTDKQERDIRLLLSGLDANPNNDRYTFYIANTYHDIGDNLNAITYYKRRVELGGWAEECWYSYYRIGICYNNMKDHANAIYYWLKAYAHTPNRIESLYRVVQHYRIEEEYILAYQFYKLAYNERDIYKNQEFWDKLFVEKDIYDFKLDYELSVIGYYCKEYCSSEELQMACMKVISHPSTELSICENVICNLKFFVGKITDMAIYNEITLSNFATLDSIGRNFTESGFVRSTPTMCLDIYGRLIVGVRFVNYTIDDDGKYMNNNTIASHNVIAIFNIRGMGGWKKIDEFNLLYNTKHDGIYIGLEDLRLFRAEGTRDICYNANRGIENGDMVIEHGKIDMENHRCYDEAFLVYPEQKSLEKNWVLFDAQESGVDSSINCIYKWFPLTIGKLKDNALTQIIEIPTPNFFRLMRGSTNGVIVDTEIWFITHVVSYDDKRHYYHCIVAIDRLTHALKKYSPLMTFQSSAVEYVLGLTYWESTQKFGIGYSIMDRETKYIMVKKTSIDDIMIIM